MEELWFLMMIWISWSFEGFLSVYVFMEKILRNIIVAMIVICYWRGVMAYLHDFSVCCVNMDVEPD